MKKGFKKVIGLGVATFLIASNAITAWAGNVSGSDGYHVYMEGSSEKPGVEEVFENYLYRDSYAHCAICPPTETFTFVRAKSSANPETLMVRYAGVVEENIDGTIQSWPQDFYEVPFEYDKEYPLKYKDGYERIEVTVYDTQDGSSMWWLFKLDPNLAGTETTQNNTATGQWIQDSTGWWYQNPDMSYPKSTWQEIDGKWYYFNENGYMLENTVTPDGNKVGADGARIGK